MERVNAAAATARSTIARARRIRLHTARKLKENRLDWERVGKLERETGFEPATNSLEGCDSTPELLPPVSTRPFVFPFPGRAWLPGEVSGAHEQI